VFADGVVRREERAEADSCHGLSPSSIDEMPND